MVRGMAPPPVDAAALVVADRTGTPVLTRQCHTALMLEALPAEVRAKIDQALATPRVPTPMIVAVLDKHGLPARAENVNRHRRRLLGGTYACKCPVTREATP